MLNYRRVFASNQKPPLAGTYVLGELNIALLFEYCTFMYLCWWFWCFFEVHFWGPWIWSTFWGWVHETIVLTDGLPAKPGWFDRIIMCSKKISYTEVCCCFLCVSSDMLFESVWCTACVGLWAFCFYYTNCHWSVAILPTKGPVLA